MKAPEFPPLEPGQMMAIFPDGYNAGKFYERLLANPGAEYAVPDSVRRNQRNGRVVSWRVDMEAMATAADLYGTPADEAGLVQYVRDLAITVGAYGTRRTDWARWVEDRREGSPGKVAFLNGLACPPEI